MLAFCTNPKCSSVFEARHLFSNLTVHLVGVATNCPICNSSAFIPDGKYQVAADGIGKFLSGPAFSVDILKRFRDLVRDAQQRKYSSEEFVQAAAKIDPGLGYISKYITRDNYRDFMLFLTVLVAVIGNIISCKSNENSEGRINSPTYNTTNTHNTTNYYYNRSPEEPTASKQKTTVETKPIDNAKRVKGSNYTAPKKKRKRNR